MKLDRKVHFTLLFHMAGLKPYEVANKLNITRDGLYKKIKGDIKFHEQDIVLLMKILNKPFEEIFIQPKIN